MKRNILRRFFIAAMVILTAITSTDCKKQVKCGCGKDVLYTLTNSSANIYFNETGTSIYFQPLGDPYSTYYFCNPAEMFPNLADAKSGDILQVSGLVYWDCNYVYQSSNSSYQSVYKIYNVQVTELTLDLYGKNSSVTPQ
jgi:hypothetical protein